MENFKFAVCYLDDKNLNHSRSVVNSFLKSVSTVYGFHCTIYPDHQISDEVRLSDSDDTRYIRDIACFESLYDTAHAQKLVEVLNLIRKESEIGRFVFDLFQSRL